MLFSLTELSYMHIFYFDKGSRSGSRAEKVIINTWLSELDNIWQVKITRISIMFLILFVQNQAVQIWYLC